MLILGLKWLIKWLLWNPVNTLINRQAQTKIREKEIIERQKDKKTSRKAKEKAWFRVFVTYLSVVILSKNSCEVNKRQN